MKQIIIFLAMGFVILNGCNSKESNEKSKDRISPEMATTLKKAMVEDLTGSETSKTNNIQKYCDCVVDSLQTSFTKQEIMEAEFTDSRKYKKVQDTCMKSTRIK